MRRCVICDKVITPTYWLCTKCAEEYSVIGKPYKEWPEWIRELIRLQRRFERSEIDTVEYIENL